MPQESEANAALLFSLVHDIKVSWGGVELSTKKEDLRATIRAIFRPKKNILSTNLANGMLLKLSPTNLEAFRTYNENYIGIFHRMLRRLKNL